MHEDFLFWRTISLICSSSVVAVSQNEWKECFVLLALQVLLQLEAREKYLMRKNWRNPRLTELGSRVARLYSSITRLRSSGRRGSLLLVLDMSGSVLWQRSNDDILRELQCTAARISCSGICSQRERVSVRVFWGKKTTSRLNFFGSLHGCFRQYIILFLKCR